jgi:hypothetical protein
MLGAAFKPRPGPIRAVTILRVGSGARPGPAIEQFVVTPGLTVVRIWTE